MVVFATAPSAWSVYRTTEQLTQRFFSIIMLLLWWGYLKIKAHKFNGNMSLFFLLSEIALLLILCHLCHCWYTNKPLHFFFFPLLLFFFFLPLSSLCHSYSRTSDTHFIISWLKNTRDFPEFISRAVKLFKSPNQNRQMCCEKVQTARMSPLQCHIWISHKRDIHSK